MLARLPGRVAPTQFPGEKLLTDYIYRNLSDPLIRIGTIKMILVGAFDSSLE